MLKHALKYIKMGWHIFPIIPGDKKPLTKNGLKDATTDETIVRAWWKKWPTANIGLRCGATSGVFAIDIDIDAEKKINGFDSLDKLGELPKTVMQTTPRGGAHFLFKAKNPPINKNSFRPGVDIRSEGYYIVITPSMNGNGKGYKWVEGQGPDEIELAEYPDFMRPKKKLAPLPWELPPKPKATPVSKPETTVLVNDITDRARLYLAECEPAIQGSAGHDSLLWAARAMVVGFQLGDMDAISLLWSEFNPRCKPMWDYGDPSDRKDFERKVVEARTTACQKPPGWLLTEYGLQEMDDEDFAEAQAQLAKGLLKKEMAPEPPRIEVVSKYARASASTGGPPEFLLNPPGFVGEIAAWINETALCYQPWLSVGAALSFVGALMGQKVCDEWDSRTNIYAMAVAPSSAGKEHARNQLSRLAGAAGIENDILGGNTVTSDSAIERRLLAYPNTLFLMDEIGHFMKNIKPTFGGTAHMSTIVPCFMTMYSSSKSLYLGKEFAGNGQGEVRKQIVQPCCCIYGTTTPEKLYEGLTPAEIEDGWLGRVLMFFSNTEPKKNWEKAKKLPVPEHLVKKVQDWWMRRPPAPTGIADINAACGIHPEIVPTTGAGHDVYLRFEELSEEMQAANKNKGVDKLWKKGGENVRRVGLIIAAGDNWEKPAIDTVHADWACQMGEYQLRETAQIAEDHLSDGIVDKEKQILFNIVKATGEKGIPKSALSRATNNMKQKQRNDHLADLIEQKKIVAGERPGVKKSSVCYWAWPHGLADKLTKGDE